MIEQIPTNDAGQLEFRFSGQITQGDYDAVMVPALEAALKQSDRVRVLALFDDSFSGYDMDAAWADTKLGLSHWRGFDRLAVATDTGWLRIAIHVGGAVLPCPVKVFKLSEEEDARRWLRESLGSVHLTEMDGGALHVQLMGQLDEESIRRAEDGIADHIRKTGGLKLMIDLREFDGWAGLSALAAHFNLVRENAPDADRIAILGRHAWQEMAERIFGRMLPGKTKFFDEDERATAEFWLTGADAG